KGRRRKAAMRRRKLMAWLLLLAFVAVAGTMGVLWLTAPTPGLTEENAVRLRAGMSVQQVQKIFGRRGVRWTRSDSCAYMWHNETGLLVNAHFDKHGNLTTASMATHPSVWQGINVNESFFDMLRRWLRL